MPPKNMDLALRFCEDMLPSLEDSVIHELRCLACEEFMCQPIFHCEKGHSFCSKCNAIGTVCDLCYSRKSGNRTHYLERLMELLTVRCRNFGNGCQKRYNPQKLERHETECQTIQIMCPLGQGNKCSFKGTKKQIVFHCQLAHSDFTFVGEKCFKQRILDGNFLANINYLRSITPKSNLYQKLYLYYTQDILFRGSVQFGQFSVEIRMCRVSVPSEMDETYYFLIKLYDFEENVIDSFRRKCGVSCVSDENNVNEGEYAQIGFEILQRCRYFTIGFMESTQDMQILLP